MRFMAMWMWLFMLVTAMAVVAEEAQLSAEAQMLQQQLSFQIPMTVRGWVMTEVQLARMDTRCDERVIRTDALARFAGRPLTMTDQDALVFLVLTEMLQEMDRDARRVQVQAARAAQPKTATNATAQTTVTATNAVSEMLAQREQASQERRAKFIALANEIARRNPALQNNLFQDMR